MNKVPQILPAHRRCFKICSLVCSLFLTLATFGQQTYLDTFSSISYSQNNGNSNFSSNWTESNDDGSSNSGRIRVNSNQLRFNNLDNAFIYRFAPLSGASSVTLTFDYDATSRGDEALDAYVYNATSGSWDFVTRLNSSNTGSISYNLTAAQIASNPAIIFSSGSGNWNTSETIFIDNVLFTAVFSPIITIEDVTVNENAGTAIFTVTHSGANAGGAFTVNYQTVDGNANAGSDYTGIASGTLNFNGTSGDTEQIIVTILDDINTEGNENFTIQFTSVSDLSVDITDTAIGTIDDDEIILNDTPLVLFNEFNGYYDYAVTGGSLRDQSNTVDACSITTASSVTGLTTTIPGTATIERAYLLWAHSNQNPDTQVTFEGQTVNADIVYSSSLSGNRLFYGMMSDVTTLITGITNPSTNVYDFSNLNVDNTDTFAQYCTTATTLGGWSLIIFYEEPSLPAVSVNMYHGFKGESNTSNSYTLDGFFAIGATGAKTTVLSWEGDSTLDGNSSGTTNPNGESLIVTNQAGTPFVQSGDGGQTGNNAYNSTIYDNTVSPVINTTNSYGVDLDTYDISSYIAPADSQITVGVNAGQDFVIANLVLVKVPSNLIVGNVFEDVNYGGGAGRDQATSGGADVEGATVELYNSLGVLDETVTSDASGQYSIGGMANGSYSVRVVNSSVNSTRGGGTSCVTCLPVQTYRRNYVTGVGFTEITNEVGGANPANADVAAGTLTNAQTVSSVTIASQGVVGLDFGFNFNTIVNTNEDGQGSLEQFIVNSNNLDETGLDIEANSIFNPASGEDTSVFMIPSTGDPLLRTADSNFGSGYFDILISNGNPLTPITASNTVIDGRTQTAYSGNTNSGTVGSGGTTVGTSANVLPNYDLPEIQLHKDNGDVLHSQGNIVTIRNLSVYGGSNAGIVVDDGSVTISNNLLGVNALGANAGNIGNGVEITDGIVVVDGNYIATNTDTGILINGGTSTTIQNNHITSNGSDACEDNITIQSGSGVVIQQNLIENASSLGIDGDGISGSVTITENTITNSGQNGSVCSGNIENAGIRLDGNNSSITNNIIFSNGGAGVVLAGGNTSGNLISQNSMYANGTASAALGIDLDQSDAIGDGVTLNDAGDTDNGPNGGINFPVISAANGTGTNLVVEGWSRPGATIELFLTDISQGTAAPGDNQLGLSTDYGEGQIYLATFVEGSGSDLASGTSAYTDVDGNTDTTNKFKFSIAMPPGASMGQYVTATATVSNSTSEFSPFSIIKAYTIITNRRITHRVNKN